ncbi:MAG: hypothetical protein DRJ98_08630, partial [Thermoprotei archaeon]
ASIFLAVVVGLKGMTEAYVHDVMAIVELYNRPGLAISSQRPAGLEAVEINIVHITIENVDALLVSVADVSAYLGLHGARLKGSPPGFGEALVGSKLRGQLGLPAVRIDGLELNITGIISSNDYLDYSLVILDETAALLDLEWETLYEWEVREGGEPIPYAVTVPAIPALLRSVLVSVERNIRLITDLIYAMACMAGFFLAGSSSLEARRTIKVLASAGFTLKGLLFSLMALSIVLAALSAIIGASLGMLVPTLISAVTSIFLKLPYIRPMAYESMYLDALWYFLLLFVCFFTGFVRGLVDVISGD